MGGYDSASVLICNPGCVEHNLSVRHPCCGTACYHIHSHNCTCVEERVTYVVSVSEIYEFLSAESTFLLLDCDHVCKGLTWVLQVIETADYRNGCCIAETVHDLVIECTVHYSVNKSAHDECCILYGLTVTHLHFCSLNVECVPSEFTDGHIK